MEEAFYNIKNVKLLETLNSLSDYILTGTFVEEANQLPKTDIDCTSEKYLTECFTNPIKNYDMAEYECLLNLQNKDDFITDKLKILKHHLRAYNNAIAALYPFNGYISWHHNGNASGYNILFTYAIDEQGYFKYYDHRNKKVITVQDKKGWSVKFNYFSNQFLTTNVLWHCAKTINPRISIGFHIGKDDKERLKTLLSKI